MARQPLSARVGILEERVDKLAQIPARMDVLASRIDSLESQFVQFRESVGVEFSAVRQEMRHGFVAVTTALGSQIFRLEQRLDGIDRRFDGIDQKFEGIDRRFEAIDQRFAAVDQRFDGLERKIDQSSGQSRALFEEIISRLKTISER
jgi:predicted  nucleic acid-binding Zn-ribbon protein